MTTQNWDSLEPLGCAVVGLGWMGGIRADALSRLPGLRLVACCDSDQGARERVPAGVRFTDSLEEVVADDGVEAVFVCTPDGAHRAPAVAALEAGKDVFCEKPLATTLEDADAILSAAKSSRRSLVVGQTLRAEGRFAAARAKVQSGELGEPVHCFSRRSWPAAEGRRMSANTTLPLYLSVHDFDALQWISGTSITRVSGEASRVALDGIQGAPSAVAALRFATGLVGAHEVSWAIPDQSGLALGDCSLSVVGTKGYVSVEARTQGVVFFGGLDAPPVRVPSTEFSPKGYVEFPDLYDFELGVATGPYATEVAAFARTVRAGDPPLASGEDGRRALAAVLAFEQSISNGAPAAVEGATSGAQD